MYLTIKTAKRIATEVNRELKPSTKVAYSDVLAIIDPISGEFYADIMDGILGSEVSHKIREKCGI